MKSTILFFHYGSDWIRGSEVCLINLIEHLDKTKFNAVLVTNCKPLINCLSGEIQTLYIDVPILFGYSDSRFQLFHYVRLLKKLNKIIDQYDVDIIHANSGAPCQSALPLARWKNIPILSHLHAPYVFRDRLSLLLPLVDCCIGVSEYVISELKKEFPTKKNVDVIYNACKVNADDRGERNEINLRKMIGVNKDSFLMVSIGSLIERKGMDFLITSTQKMNELGMDVELVVIGSGEKEAELKKMALKNCMSKERSCIHFLQYENDASQLLNGHVDVLVSGAREEAFGLTFVEAGLRGVTSVAPKLGGITEVITDNRTGLLYEPESQHDFIGAISKLYGNAILKDSLSKTAACMYSEKFNISLYVDKFESKYARLLDGSKNSHNHQFKIFEVLKMVFEIQISSYRWLAGKVHNAVGGSLKI